MQFLKRKFVIKLQAEDLQLIKNEGAAQMFSCKSCEIFKNTFFIERTPLKTPVIRTSFSYQNHCVVCYEELHHKNILERKLFLDLISFVSVIFRSRSFSIFIVSFIINSKVK